MEPETIPTEQDQMTPEEVAAVVNFIGTFYPEEIEGVQRPEEIEPGVFSYVFQDGKKVVEAIVNEQKMTISSKILNPDEI